MNATPGPGTAGRNTASTARNEANRLRTAGTPATGLARAFAEIARHLDDAVNLDDVLHRIADVSVSAVPGCEMASITVRDGDGDFRTLASTHAAATAVDQAKYEASEGPCLTAVGEAVVYTPVFPDPRWPALGTRPAEAGVRSAVSYSLAPSGPVSEAGLAGWPNAYAGAARAFDDEARDIGLILAPMPRSRLARWASATPWSNWAISCTTRWPRGTSSGRPRAS